MEHWWNDTDRGNPKYWEKKMSTTSIFCVIDWPRIEPRPKIKREKKKSFIGVQLEALHLL
jgi:hypothetical protein